MSINSKLESMMPLTSRLNRFISYGPAHLEQIADKLKLYSIQAWILGLLTLLLFSIPLSTSAKSIVIVTVCCLIIVTPTYRVALIQVFKQQSWCWLMIGLMLICVVGCCFSPASLHEKSLILEKYTKLIYLPILAVGFRDERARRAGLLAFLCAMALTCVISMGKAWHLLQHDFGVASGPGSVFRNHIMTSHMMVFAAFIAAVKAIDHPGRLRIMYAMLSLVLSYQILFINTSRTGYVMYLFLLMLWILQNFAWRKALLGLLIAGSLFFAIVTVSPVMQEKMHEAVTECQRYLQKDRDTSIGYRLQFHHFAQVLYQRHPWFGNGTGSFTYHFGAENPVPSWGHGLLEPHSQYWLVLSEWGRLGFIVFLGFLASLFFASLRLHKMRNIGIALISAFLLGNVSDSLLFYSGTGYLFITLMALCLGEGLQRDS